MAEISVNIWKKALEMDREHIIRFQLSVHCLLTDIRITDKELDTLTLLGMQGESELRLLCPILVTKGIFTSTESARNALVRLEEKNLLHKEGKNRKSISLEPQMQVQTTGNIMLDIKCLARE